LTKKIKRINYRKGGKYAEEVYFIEDEDFPSYEELRKLEENE